jgi:hypothetical protein
VPRYLLTVSDADAARLERWLGFRLIITPGTGVSEPVDVAGLDAVTDGELAEVYARLRAGGPLYHATGPTTVGREAARSELSKLLGAHPVGERSAGAHLPGRPDPLPRGKITIISLLQLSEQVD